jgi:S1-C subfamily serine protease
MRSTAKLVLAMFVGMALSWALLTVYLPGPLRGAEPLSLRLGPVAASSDPRVSESDIVSEVYERVSPAVVNITSTAQATDIFGRPVRQEGTGSGFLIDDEGHIATNQHVVSGATRLDVTLADGTSYVGEVIGSDSANDLALIRIRAPAEKLRDLTVAPLGDSRTLRVGQTVIAIGNPFGLERSASLGIVSSLGRTRPGTEQRLIANMIQTDAAINPGNSGGPLLSLRGEVIGINAQIDSPSRGNVGIGFAIPVNTFKRYLPELVAGKEPKHAWLGISGRALTPTLSERVGAPVQQGVLLVSLAPGGPAARAGLRGVSRSDVSTADIITEIDGHSVRSVEDVAAQVDDRDPGQSVRVTYLRGGQASSVDVLLGVWEPRDTP